MSISSSVAFDEFPEKFPNLEFCGLERAASEWRRAINPAEGLSVAHLRGAQIALFFQAMQKRVQRAHTDVITMTAEFFRHPQAEKRAFHGVMEDMQPDQSGVKIAVIHSCVFLYRYSITNINFVKSACLAPPSVGPQRLADCLRLRRALKQLESLRLATRGAKPGNIALHLRLAR